MQIPKFIYGTAWKEKQTANLVTLALKNGFTAIDTANQRKHYFEQAVGDGLLAAYKNKYISREKLFLQTKFTFARGQDSRKPYEDSDPYPIQVNKSIASSLEHLHTDYLDSYVLHGPYSFNVGQEDLTVWQTMEELIAARKVKSLGISNVNIKQLRELCDRVTVKPSFVQNRCFAATGWDKEVREFCKQQNIYYQGFSLLTANVRELQHPKVQAIATAAGLTIPQLVFNFAISLNMIPLTGTTSAEHMQMDLNCLQTNLNTDQLSFIEEIAFN